MESNVFQECVQLTISFHLYFLRVSKVWSMLHHGSLERIHSKKCNSKSTYTFLSIFVVFHKKKCVFCHFSFLFLKYEICRYFTFDLQLLLFAQLETGLGDNNCQWSCVPFITYSPYKVKWLIPKVLLKACTINLNPLNCISIF